MKENALKCRRKHNLRSIWISMHVNKTVNEGTPLSVNRNSSPSGRLAL